MSVSPQQGPLELVECLAAETAAPVIESLAGREIELGGIPVTRVLPLRQRRMVGPWCFIDRFGPVDFSNANPMDVAPHPHIGLQTVTWLLDGEIRHDDSLACQAVTRPGGVSVMTAGRAIAHSEQTPEPHGAHLDGVQLWVALPNEARNGEPGFAAIEHVPILDMAGGLVRLFAGSILGETSPAPHHSPILGLDVEVHAGAAVELPLTPGWEHTLVVLYGQATLDGQGLAGHQLHYLGTQRHAIDVSSAAGSRLLLLGGPPFPEKILMWWNFVARTEEEIAIAREDWMNYRRFPEVAAYRGARLNAPSLAGFHPRPST
jgi:redox-sensitive bicupin YhaK (pirin superfamily)